jgi:hypothetical protein
VRAAELPRPCRGTSRAIVGIDRQWDGTSKLRWPADEHFNLEAYFRVWRQVRDVDFSIDQSTGEAVLLFTRKVGQRRRVSPNSQFSPRPTCFLLGQSRSGQLVG